MKTKLSDLVKTIQGVTRTSVISYAWHKANGNTDRFALVISLSNEALKQARFRDGDMCDVEFDESALTMTIVFGDKLPFSCCLKSKTSSQRHIKISSQGIEAAMCILPKRDTLFEMTILQFEVGKIHVRLPSPA